MSEQSLIQVNKKSESHDESKLPKMRSFKDRQIRRVQNTAIRRANSSREAIEEQKRLLSVLEKKRSHADCEDFALTKSIERLIKSFLISVLMLAEDNMFMDHAEIIELHNQATQPEFARQVNKRTALSLYVEKNIDRLLVVFQEYEISKYENESLRQTSSEADADNMAADNDDDECSASLICDEEIAMNGCHVYMSCVSSLVHIRDLLVTRNKNRKDFEREEQKIGTRLFGMLRANFDKSHFCDSSTDESSTCAICSFEYSSERRCITPKLCPCFEKQVCCFPCLLTMAFVSSEMGTKSFHQCAFCKKEISMYGHLDIPQPAVFAQSIADSIKQNKRKVSSGSSASHSENTGPSNNSHAIGIVKRIRQ